MKVSISTELIDRIEKHGERSYPEEGAGVLLGRALPDEVLIEDILPMQNSFETSQRTRRYQIDARGMLHAERTAEELDLDVVGIFHSHPDHPAQPSEFDREHSLPWYTYIITRIADGQAEISRAWRLAEDRKKFLELELAVLPMKETL